MSSLENHLRSLAAKGPIRIHLWPRYGGGFQANVSEVGVNAWTVVNDGDPIFAVAEALRQRASGVSSRTVEAGDGYMNAPPPSDREGEQVDLEEAIEAAEPLVGDPQPVDDDPFAGLIG